VCTGVKTRDVLLSLPLCLVATISSLADHRIQKAMRHWETYTCIKFVEYDRYKHSNYVIIQKGQWCASKLGMAGGAQPLYLALGCLVSSRFRYDGHTQSSFNVLVILGFKIYGQTSRESMYLLTALCMSRLEL